VHDEKPYRGKFINLQRDILSKAQELMQDLAKDTALSIIKSKLNHNKSSSILFITAFDISTIDKFTHKVIRAFAHDLKLPMTFEVTLDTENLLIEAVDAIIAQAGEDETLTKLLIDFTMEKTDDDKSWDISRGDSGWGVWFLMKIIEMKSLIFTIKPLPILSK
jgi:ATP-dependent exoDNAse (exonuclease V) beta subunit